MSGLKVYVTRRVPERGLEILRSHGCSITQWNSDDPVPRQELLNQMRQGVDALFCLLTENIDAEVLAAAGSRLKVVGTMSVGYDHIDVSECTKRGILVGFTPGVLTDTTAELTVALLLATARRIPEGVAAARSGEWGTWKPMWMCGMGLQNSTVGVIGLGRIGHTVARFVRNFGISRLVYYDMVQVPHAASVNAEFVDLDTLYRDSDFIVVNVALTPETKGMFNKSAFAKMKKNAVFINTSRGGVVNQRDLHDALRDGEIWAAGLDVTDPEPLPPSHPLYRLSNCVILPHIASATIETRQEMSALTGNNILAGLKGEKMPAQVQPMPNSRI